MARRIHITLYIKPYIDLYTMYKPFIDLYKPCIDLYMIYIKSDILF